MADASIPGAVFNQNPTGLPLETQPVSTATGLEAQFGAAMRSSLGVSLETKGIGLLQGGDVLPYDTVKSVFDDQKLDPSVFPKGQPIRRGEALAVMGQQLAIQKDQDLADRAHLGSFTGGAAGFVGGLADPAVLGTGLIAGPLLGAARAGLGGAIGHAVETGAPLAARVATGAAEGGAFVGAYEKGEQQFGTAQGDRDITTGQIVHDAVWGSVLGGAIKGAVGARPQRVDLEPMRNMIVGAENTAGYAKAHGLNPDDVVSNKGAVGIHQITPATAESLGFDPSMLKDRDYNEQVAQANLEKLYKRFGSDPEAIAIAWNAGPGTAAKFIKAGRDRSMLPKETQDYLARIDKMQATGDVAAPGSTAPEVSTSARDSGLVVARKMPDGSVMYGHPGDVHFNLMSDDEIDGKEPVDPKTMGFAQPEGQWMSREDAAASLGQEGKLEAQKYQMAQAGEMPGQFGRRGIPDVVDVATARTAVAQAEANSEINVSPVQHAMLDEQNQGRSFKTTATALRDEHEREITHIETQAYRGIGLTKAIPVRDSAMINPAKARLEQIDQQAKQRAPEPATPTGRNPHPAVAQLQALAEQAKQEAQSIHQGLTGEAKGVEGNRFEAEMADEEADRVRSEGADDLQKAVEVGTQCALTKGVE